jgi:hypothetical protein
MYPGAACFHQPIGYAPPPGVDPYAAGYPYPMAPPMGAHMAYVPSYVAGMPPAAPAYAPPLAPGVTPAGAGPHHGPRVSELIEEISNGGNGLTSLSKMLNLDDTEFWKGALVGAAAVLLLTNDSVQNALFKTGARAKSVVKTGVDRVKDTAQRATSTGEREVSDV